MDTERKSDEELMAQYQNGDMNAFNLLYMRYEKRIYNYFLKRLTNPERSAELFQDTFLKLHQYRDRFDPKLSFRAWLFTIASNIAKSEFKRAEKTKNLFDNGEVDYDIIEDTHIENPGSSLAVCVAIFSLLLKLMVPSKLIFGRIWNQGLSSIKLAIRQKMSLSNHSVRTASCI